MIELTLEYRKRKLNKYAIQTVVLSFQLRTHFQISFLLLIILEHLFHGDSFSVCVHWHCTKVRSCACSCQTEVGATANVINVTHAHLYTSAFNLCNLNKRIFTSKKKTAKIFSELLFVVENISSFFNLELKTWKLKTGIWSGSNTPAV